MQNIEKRKDCKIKIKILAISAALMLLAIRISCKQNPSELVNKSIVQIWIPASITGNSAVLVSSGVIVGDGSQVLTLLDYEEYSPGPIEVVTRGEKYKASIQAIDARNGLTLLKLEGAKKLPVARFGNSPAPNQTVLGWVWNGSDLAVRESMVVRSEPASGTMFFKINNDPGFFPTSIDTGTVVSDKDGKIIGLALPTHWRLAPLLNVPSPIIAFVNNELDLLKPDFLTSPAADGPALSMISGNRSTIGNFAGVLPVPSDYEQMTQALKVITGSLGEPTATDDLEFGPPWFFFEDTRLLVVLYPRTVELRSINGELLAEAKWVGIQWYNSEGKTNRLIYGTEPYTIHGGYKIQGNINALNESVPPP